MTTSTMTRERAIEIARQAAEHRKPSYYAEPFEPHEWVVDAILNAAHLAVHERFDATALGDVVEAWIDFPSEGQVKTGLGEPFSRLLNAVGRLVGRDELLNDPEVQRRGTVASAKARVLWLRDQLAGWRRPDGWLEQDSESVAAHVRTIEHRLIADLAEAEAKARDLGIELES